MATLVAFGYLYFPIALFFVTWIRWHLAIPALILLVASVVKMLRKDWAITLRSPLRLANSRFVILFLLCIGICFLAGINGDIQQAGDWEKHNILLRSLIDYNWPVRYDLDGEKGVLSYYIGGYLIPAAVGKVTNFDTAQNVMMLWFALGLFLCCCIVACLLDREGKHWYTLFVVFGVLMLFGTFVTPISGIYRVLRPETVGNGVHWLSEALRVQYTPNLLLLRWVTPQFVPSTIAVVLLLQYRKRVDVWGVILAPIVLYSTFAFVGMAFFMLLLFLFDLWEQKRGERLSLVWSILSLENIAGVLTAMILVAYIACNILQEKPESAGMGFTLVDYRQYPFIFILFHLAWLIWVYLLWPWEKKNNWLYACAVSLFLIPFVYMGHFNDFCMRASIPALMGLCVLVVGNFYRFLCEKKYYLALGLAVCLAFTSIGPIKELDDSVDQTVWGGQISYENTRSAEEFLAGDDFIRYQYVSWQPDGLAKYILQE